MSVRGDIITTLKARLAAMTLSGVGVGYIMEQGARDNSAQRSQALAADKISIDLLIGDDSPDGGSETNLIEQVRFPVCVLTHVPWSKVDEDNPGLTAQAWHEKVYACYSKDTDVTWETFGGLALETVHEGGGAAYIDEQDQFTVRNLFTIRYRFKRGNLSQAHP